MITLQQFHCTGRRTSIYNYFTRSTAITGAPTLIINATQRIGNLAGRGVKDTKVLIEYIYLGYWYCNNYSISLP